MLAGQKTKPRTLTILLLAVVIGTAKASDMLEEEKEQTTGVFHHWDSTEGYNFFVPEEGIGSYIIDNEGKILHSWTHPDGLLLGGSAYLTEEGTLLRTAKVPNEYFSSKYHGGSIMEFDADGTCRWEFRYSSSIYRQLMDFLILPNGNLVVSASENHPWFDAVMKGYKGDIRTSPDGYWSQTLVEVPRRGRDNPEYDSYAKFKDGNFTNTCKTFSDELDLVWKWDSFDISSDYLKYSHWDINKSFLMHSIDHLPERDHILISCAFCGEVFIIDHAVDYTKTSGSEGVFIYRWGNPSNYGVEGDQKLDPGHADWVRDNYGWKFNDKDKGSILVFNNEDVDNKGKSSVVEITPPYKDGKYEKEKDGSFGPKDVDFKILDIQEKFKVKKETKDYGFGGGNNRGPGGSYNFGGRPRGRLLYGGYDQSNRFYQEEYYYEIEWTSFYSDALGYAQPLPNGNVLVTASRSGRAIEIEKLDRSDWEYISPVINDPGKNFLKGHDTVLGLYDKIPICNEYGDHCNSIVALIKYSKDFKGFEKIFKE